MGMEMPNLDIPAAETPKKNDSLADKFKKGFRKAVVPGMFIISAIAPMKSFGETPTQMTKGKAETTQAAKTGHERMEAKPIAFAAPTTSSEEFNIDDMFKAQPTGTTLETKKAHINTEGVIADQDAQEKGQEITVTGKTQAEVDKKIAEIQKKHNQEKTVMNFASVDESK